MGERGYIFRTLNYATKPFDFEDGTAQGWLVGVPTSNPAKGKFALSAPINANPRFKSPKLDFEIGDDPWFSMRVYADEKVFIRVTFYLTANRDFDARLHHEGQGWQGLALPLAWNDISGPGQNRLWSKPGDKLTLITLSVQSLKEKSIPLSLDNVVITGGKGGVAEEPSRDAF